MSDQLTGLLIILIVLIMGLWAFWAFMQWESKNAAKLQLGLISKDDGLSYYTILPDWANDAWKPTNFNLLYTEAKWNL